METVTVPESVCIDGEWFAAHWQLQAVDGGSSELLITASAAGRDLVLRMDMGREFLLSLRGLAGIEGPLPVDEARGELAYWRESVQFAVNMLAQGRTVGQDYRQAAWNTESYLRQLLALDGEQDQTYDVAHACNGVRFAELEREAGIQKQRINALGKRMEEMSHQVGLLQAEHVTPADVQQDRDRLGYLEAIRRELVDRTAANERSIGGHSSFITGYGRRLDALEYTVRNLQRLAQSDHGSEAGL